MHATLTFLGTGTSMGVPTVGCACAVCTSADARDRRLRPSILVRWNAPADPSCRRAVVIDTGPDFRQQALAAHLTHLDAVLYTHSHADHILGMDDLRPLSFGAKRAGGTIPLYASDETAAVLRRIYDYTFADDASYINRARVEIARSRTAPAFTRPNLFACRCCMAIWKSPAFASAMPLILPT